jgi:putative phosphoribosyl transferase
MEKYTNRIEAGKILANELKAYAKQPDALILALPRGGVPVAYEIAEALSVPLDVFIVRKLGLPGHEELALGAMAMDGTIIMNDELLRLIPFSPHVIERVVELEKKELQRRIELYRNNQPLPDLKNKTVILVDDGIATGATMRAAITVLKQQEIKKLIVAVPVAARDTCEIIIKEVDQFICPLRPEYFYGVGLWYDDFSQTDDSEVLALLARARANREKM